jgi:hypothetical protein
VSVVQENFLSVAPPPRRLAQSVLERPLTLASLRSPPRVHSATFESTHPGALAPMRFANRSPVYASTPTTVEIPALSVHR